MSLRAFPRPIAPSSFSLSCRVPNVSSSLISQYSFSITSPASSSSSMYIMLTPVSVSPFKMAECIGEAPLYFGSREECTFIIPYFGISIISLGIILPYATTTIKSGLTSFILLITSSSFILFGCIISISLSRPNCLTGEYIILFPLAFRLSSFVKISFKSVFLYTVSRLGIANSGVPINIVFTKTSSYLNILPLHKILPQNSKKSRCLPYIFSLYCNLFSKFPIFLPPDACSIRKFCL